MEYNRYVDIPHGAGGLQAAHKIIQSGALGPWRAAVAGSRYDPSMQGAATQGATMALPKGLFMGALILVCVVGSEGLARSECKAPAALALASDAHRASLWNWGWGGLFAASAVGHASLALLTDNEKAEVALWTGTAKSTAGVLSVLIQPIRLYPSKRACAELKPLLLEAAEIERKRHSWLAHATTLSVNIAAFSYVQYKTGDLRFSVPGTVLGLVVGELTILSAPNRVRSGGFALESLTLVPVIEADHQGLMLSFLL